MSKFNPLKWMPEWANVKNYVAEIPDRVIAAPRKAFNRAKEYTRIAKGNIPEFIEYKWANFRKDASDPEVQMDTHDQQYAGVGITKYAKNTKIDTNFGNFFDQITVDFFLDEDAKQKLKKTMSATNPACFLTKNPKGEFTLVEMLDNLLISNNTQYSSLRIPCTNALRDSLTVFEKKLSIDKNLKSAKSSWFSACFKTGTCMTLITISLMIIFDIKINEINGMTSKLVGELSSKLQNNASISKFGSITPYLNSIGSICKGIWSKSSSYAKNYPKLISTLIGIALAYNLLEGLMGMREANEKYVDSLKKVYIYMNREYGNYKKIHQTPALLLNTNTDLSKDVKSVLGKVEALEQQILQMSTTLTSISSDVSQNELSKKCAQLAQDIHNLKQDLNEKNRSLEKLGNTLNQTQEELGSQKKEKAKLYELLGESEKKQTELSKKLNPLIQSIIGLSDEFFVKLATSNEKEFKTILSTIEGVNKEKATAISKAIAAENKYEIPGITT